VDKLKGKIAFITGASSGIGKACAAAFANEGADLIISARKLDVVKNVASEIEKRWGVKVLSLKLDVRNQSDVLTAVNTLPAEWKNIDILVNNAGLALGLDKFQEGNTEHWDTMIDTNIKGLLYVSKAVIPLMIEREKGHVINLGSIAGHEAYPKGAVYCATKHAVDAITKSMRMDLLEHNIKISSIDPGAVETNFSNIRFEGDREKANNVYKGIDPLVAEDIADVALFIVSRPAHVNIADVIVFPAQQASASVTYRK
jgi:NADP-dependent 3-hydroxy acid dehydrogenase YdfG